MILPQLHITRLGPGETPFGVGNHYCSFVAWRGSRDAADFFVLPFSDNRRTRKVFSLQLNSRTKTYIVGAKINCHDQKAYAKQGEA